MATFKVIDVSSHQGTIASGTWDAFAKNCDWVILRAGYKGYSGGTLVTDEQLSNNISACEKRNLPYGIYWLSQAVTEEEARGEVAYIEKIVGSLSKIAGGVWLDSEWSNNNHNGRADKLSKADRTAVSVAWLKEATSRGAYAGIYASTSWFSEHLNDAQLTGWAHWVAQYATKCTYSGAVTGWQFSESNGFGLGSSKSLDCSYFYVNVPEKVNGISAKTTSTYTKTQFIKDVQTATGVTVDGIAGAKTLAATPTISATKNRTHKAVKAVQKYLMAQGYSQVGTADGVAGAKFTAAVKAYQAKNGCTADGEITAKGKTWKKLLGLA
jgi:GH25 family lysozyme M1 (1,4-beta-N-acetylmuramidase)